MSKKRIILAFLNLFFMCVAVYTIYVFSTHGKEFSADELIKNSILKQKEFSAKVEEIETQRGQFANYISRIFRIIINIDQTRECFLFFFFQSFLC